MLLDFRRQIAWRAGQRRQPAGLRTLFVVNVVSLVGAGATINWCCQAQVRDLELSISANQQVGDLNISVSKATLMDGLDSFQKLKEELKSM